MAFEEVSRRVLRYRVPPFFYRHSDCASRNKTLYKFGFVSWCETRTQRASVKREEQGAIACRRRQAVDSTVANMYDAGDTRMFVIANSTRRVRVLLSV